MCILVLDLGAINSVFPPRTVTKALNKDSTKIATKIYN